MSCAAGFCAVSVLGEALGADGGAGVFCGAAVLWAWWPWGVLLPVVASVALPAFAAPEPAVCVAVLPPPWPVPAALPWPCSEMGSHQIRDARTMISSRIASAGVPYLRMGFSFAGCCELRGRRFAGWPWGVLDTGGVGHAGSRTSRAVFMGLP